MEINMKNISLLLVVIFLQGCSSFLSGFGNERAAGSVIQPGERLVIKNIQFDGSGDRFDLICSEPPPDVATSVFNAISASLSGEVEATAKGGAALTSISNSDFLKLFERSQGIQGLRDGMYRSCEAYMNGGITRETYGQQMTYMTATLNFLVTIELCGKILDAKDLVVKEANSKGDLAQDMRPELYKQCLDTANTFARSILDSSTSFQKESLKYQ